MNIKNLLPSVLTYIKRRFFFQSSFYFLDKATLGTKQTSCYNRLILFEATLVQSSEVTEFIHPGQCFASHLLVSFCFSRESIRRGGLWFAVTLSCSTWPLRTPSHPSEDFQEPLANPADEMKIFHLSLLKPLSDNNFGESDLPAEKSINKGQNTYCFWGKVLFADLFLQPLSILAFYILHLRYIALMRRYGLQSQSIPCDCPLWWAQNPSSNNGIHLRLYIACICYLWPSSNKSNLVSLMWTTDHCKLVKESG